MFQIIFKKFGVIYYLLFCIIVLPIFMANRCSEINSHVLLKYRLFNKRVRSAQSILMQRNLSSFNECQELATSRKALAFNFNSMTRSTVHSTRQKNNRNINNINSNVNNTINYSCQVLDCPETDASTSFIRDKKFNYYSLYPRKLLIAINSNDNYSTVCLPSVGLFILSKEHKNYTDAQNACKSMQGVLAHIVSAERTQGLAKFISASVFVGLSNRDARERIWKNELDEPLSCFDYRGWGKGEPTHSRGCVKLDKVTKSSRNFQSFWKVTSCSRKMPFICEIMPLTIENEKL